ncbi:RNA ligase family protein [Halogeometricum limi]|uniref:RNA ligase domain-containing protein n=1 Tax=Halogeometricum limi TaxID=555875 RepID=A0A1I6IEY4_9EURY|nr:RNA ligase family protein [Halogeometricum limi]SFR65256.1 hypothetical protein SAMN04488124_3164 [Halogeometricum limi]
MKQYPPIPPVEDAPDGLLDAGHLWILEKVDGGHLRFQLRESGVLRFGDRTRVFGDADDVPLPYRHAVRHVRENIDREALRRAVDDVEAVVFFGEAMHHHVIEYDWHRTPPFLGFDVWSDRVDGFRPPDTASHIFERLGLRPVNALERERHTRDFDAESYAVPSSAWYDGPAEGVVVRNKRGGRAQILHPRFREADDSTADGPEPADGTVEELAARYATRRRFDRLASVLEATYGSVSFDTLYERAFEDVVREKHGRLFGGGRSIDVQAFRSELAALTREYLRERES